MSKPTRLLPMLVCLVICVVAAALALARAQEQPPAQPRPTFRTDANLVRVDVYPMIDGRAVRDLMQADFEVLEDGVPQALASFEHVEVRAAGPEEARREPNTAREGRAMAEDPRARVFVFFLDTYFTEISGSHRVQTLLTNMLNRVVGEDDLFAVMTPQMSAKDITLARRSTTMEGYLSKYWFWGQRHRLYPEDPVERRYLDCFPAKNARCSMPGVAEEMIQRRREKRVVDALADLSQYLGGVREERKAVIAISNGWLLHRPNPALERLSGCGGPPGAGQPGTTPDGRLTSDRMRSEYGYSQYDCDTDRQLLANLDIWQDYQDLMDVANRANVSFYPIDSRGLAAFDNDLSGPILPANVEFRLVQNRVQSLRTLAENTDGLAVVDTNNLEKGIHRIVDDLTSYYLLGYYSTNTKLDGKYRKITVRVKRPGVDVRARRGYRAATPEELERGRAEETAAAAAAPASAVQAALNSIGVSRPGVPLRTAVSYAALGTNGSTGRRVRLWSLAELDRGLLRDGEWLGGGEVNVMVSASDGSPLATRSVPLAGGQRSVSIDMGEIDLPDGEIVIRTRVKPLNDGLPVSDTLRLPTTGGADTPGVPLMLRRGPTTGIKYLPTADKQFRRTDRLRLELPTSGSIGTTSAEVLDRAGNAINIPVATASRLDGDLTWATAEVALAPLALGDYALKLTAQAQGKTKEVVTGFRIVP